MSNLSETSGPEHKLAAAGLTEQQWQFLIRKLSQLRVDVSLFIKENTEGIDCGTVRSVAGPALPSPPAKSVRKLLTAAESEIGWAVLGIVSHAKKAFPRLEIPPPATWKPPEPLK
jgi:hypothetical protein